MDQLLHANRMQVRMYYFSGYEKTQNMRYMVTRYI